MSETADSVDGPGEQESVRTTVVYDWRETEPTTAVLECVGRRIGDERQRPRQLYDSIEPDGLDALLQHAAMADHQQPISVCFEYAGHLVTAYGSGELIVKPLVDDE